ncbi:MAG: hypothetical protein AB8G22_26000 [Saprospiraceae bacterium]
MAFASDREPYLHVPEHFSVEELITELQISWRWYTPMYYFTAFFSLIWMGFLAFFYYLMLAGGITDSEFGYVTLLFPIIHVVAGIGITYWTICGFVNTTTVVIDVYDIMVNHHPLPWPGGKVVIDKKTVEQLYVTEKVNRGKNNTSVTYRVHAILKSGKSKVLLKGITDKDEAQFLERKMEKFLRIEDRPVTGEVKK